MIYLLNIDNLIKMINENFSLIVISLGIFFSNGKIWSHWTMDRIKNMMRKSLALGRQHGGWRHIS
jgi:hypothetical protein